MGGAEKEHRKKRRGEKKSKKPRKREGLGERNKQR